ncbi:helix-turn-helix domain-containing protein [Lutibacter sp. TH_r2]|uniref:helix-turn-helix domain-containing protein n=1 Tax=Lutibacter sp. TH_r2 TaxID=3082083 RepID=UPI002955590A|nr:helix-turn-helix domain-containing protein [Lutibacter sp. TH_r2]MDV7187633.1 helix-turn-helix domain-containing protein [Lutibacter sp. TH_r2]
MVEKVTQVHGTSPQELKDIIINDFKTELEKFSKNFQPIEQPEYLTREEVATILKISMSTISDWNRKGILNPYRLGNTIRYKSNELDQVLIQINSKKTA